MGGSDQWEILQPELVRRMNVGEEAKAYAMTARRTKADGTNSENQRWKCLVDGR
jgi:tyrosyl-tRNA synthetase